MDNKKNDNRNEIKIELTPEVASGQYSNLAVISHSAQEVFVDFVTLAPNMPQAKVTNRIIMTPENAKNLLFALRDNIAKYEQVFGEITRKAPKAPLGGGTDIPNPFQA